MCQNKKKTTKKSTKGNPNHLNSPISKSTKNKTRLKQNIDSSDEEKERGHLKIFYKTQQELLQTMKNFPNSIKW